MAYAATYPAMPSYPTTALPQMYSQPPPTYGSGGLAAPTQAAPGYPMPSYLAGGALPSSAPTTSYAPPPAAPTPNYAATAGPTPNYAAAAAPAYSSSSPSKMGYTPYTPSYTGSYTGYQGFSPPPTGQPGVYASMFRAPATEPQVPTAEMMKLVQWYKTPTGEAVAEEITVPADYKDEWKPHPKNGWPRITAGEAEDLRNKYNPGAAAAPPAGAPLPPAQAPSQNVMVYYKGPNGEVKEASGVEHDWQPDKATGWPRIPEQEAKYLKEQNENKITSPFDGMTGDDGKPGPELPKKEVPKKKRCVTC